MEIREFISSLGIGSVIFFNDYIVDGIEDIEFEVVSISEAYEVNGVLCRYVELIESVEHMREVLQECTDDGKMPDVHGTRHEMVLRSDDERISCDGNDEGITYISSSSNVGDYIIDTRNSGITNNLYNWNVFGEYNGN